MGEFLEAPGSAVTVVETWVKTCIQVLQLEELEITFSKSNSISNL